MWTSLYKNRLRLEEENSGTRMSVGMLSLLVLKNLNMSIRGSAMDWSSTWIATWVRIKLCNKESESASGQVGTLGESFLPNQTPENGKSRCTVIQKCTIVFIFCLLS